MVSRRLIICRMSCCLVRHEALRCLSPHLSLNSNIGIGRVQAENDGIFEPFGSLRLITRWAADTPP